MPASLNVHPFPARMAPELVSDYIDNLETGAVVLDPMMGSGTFILSAAENGHRAVGFDSDPLAVLICEAAAWDGDVDAVVARAIRIVAYEDVSNPRVADDETRSFINYWFDKDAQTSLASIAGGITDSAPEMQAVLWCAFSRLIVTKDAGASRARDVSHSRPHVVRELASFDPRTRFVGAVRTVLARRRGLRPEARRLLSLSRGDARNLDLDTNSIDAVMTSPPYLTAIDYLRGHRLSLVWMGYSMAQLRELRGTNIGAERGARDSEHLMAIRGASLKGELALRKSNIYNRYLLDLTALLTELTRVLKPHGTATFVVANSNHGGTSVRVDDALSFIGRSLGLNELRRSTREIPTARRYLPPPNREGSALEGRMGIETILTLSKPR